MQKLRKIIPQFCTVSVKKWSKAARRTRKKLKSQAGETLTETLVALLIAALALTMLAGAIASSFGVIQRGREKLDQYYTANEAADGVVKMSGDGTAGKVTLTDAENQLSHGDINVSYYTNDKFNNMPVVAYKIAEAEGGG